MWATNTVRDKMGEKGERNCINGFRSWWKTNKQKKKTITLYLYLNSEENVQINEPRFTYNPDSVYDNKL